jgi:hypothetical protein
MEMEITNSRGVTISGDVVLNSHEAITIKWSPNPNDCVSFIIDNTNQLHLLLNIINELIVVIVERYFPDCRR